MGGRKRYIEYEIPVTALHLAEAIIRDYPRRRQVIKYSAADDDKVIINYKTLNETIDSIIADFDPTFSKIIMNDIIERRGYDASIASSFSSRNTYYLHRKKIIQDICKALFII